MRFKWAIVAALWTGFVVAPAQSQSPVTPTKAIVTPDTTVSEAKSYVFQVEFSPAPDYWPADERGYRGTVNASFERQGDAPSSAKYNWNNSVTALSANSEPINNKHPIYKLTVPIRESMTPGEYKLVAVTIGNDHQESIPFSGNVSIKIPELHLTVARFNHPDGIEAAGKPDRFTISVGQHMEDVSKNCVVQIWPHITRPDGASFNLDPQEIHSSEQTLEFVIEKIKADAPSGVWKVDLIDQAHDPDNRHADCRRPALAPDSQHFSFKVTRNTKIVIPTSAKVTISRSQDELLRGEINGLKAQANDLPKHMKSSDGENLFILSKALGEATNELDRTKKAYIELEKNKEFLPKVSDFFDDLQITYKEAGASLKQKLVERSQPHLMNVGMRDPKSAALDAVVSAIARNAEAYEVVTKDGGLSFDFEVATNPKGATVAYYMLGKEPTPVDQETTTTIPSLPRAVYYLNIHKDGYIDKLGVRYDAVHSTRDYILVELAPAGKLPK